MSLAPKKSPYLRILALVLIALMLVACQETPDPTEPPILDPEAAGEVSEEISEEDFEEIRERRGEVAPVEAPDLAAPRVPLEPDTPTPTAPTETTTLTETTSLTETASLTETTPGTPLPTATARPTRTPAGPIATVPPPPTQPPVVTTAALTILEDETVAPPLTILVSANQELAGYHYRISGVIRNDADEPYAGLGVVATFFMEDGRRHGPIKSNVQCTILAPGETCPFLIGATAKGLTSVMLHPEGYPTERQLVPIEVRDLSTSRDAIGYVHITGQIYNPHPVAVRNVALNGTLLDDQGTIVSIGTDIILELASGGTAPFDISLRYEPYSRYEVYVQAEP